MNPQLGRFLSIDPLAYSGGQQVFSPYVAMGNSPGMMIDPNGEMTKYAEDLNFERNDWLMNAPERLAWLMGGSKSTAGAAGKMLGQNIGNTMFMYAGGGSVDGDQLLSDLSMWSSLWSVAMKAESYKQSQQHASSGSIFSNNIPYYGLIASVNGGGGVRMDDMEGGRVGDILDGGSIRSTRQLKFGGGAQ